MSRGNSTVYLHFQSFHLINILKMEAITLHLFHLLKFPKHFSFLQCCLLLVFFPLLIMSWKTGTLHDSILSCWLRNASIAVLNAGRSLFEWNQALLASGNLKGFLMGAFEVQRDGLRDYEPTLPTRCAHNPTRLIISEAGRAKSALQPLGL